MRIQVNVFTINFFYYLTYTERILDILLYLKKQYKIKDSISNIYRYLKSIENLILGRVKRNPNDRRHTVVSVIKTISRID